MREEKIIQKLLEHDKRFDAHDKRFDNHDRRFDEHDKRFDAHDRRFDAHDKRFDNHDRRFDEHDKRFDLIDQKIDNLSQAQDRIIIKLISVDTDVKELKEKSKKLDMFDTLLEGQDKMIRILERVDQERVFTNQRLEKIVLNKRAV